MEFAVAAEKVYEAIVVKYEDFYPKYIDGIGVGELIRKLDGDDKVVRVDGEMDGVVFEQILLVAAQRGEKKLSAYVKSVDTPLAPPRDGFILSEMPFEGYAVTAKADAASELVVGMECSMPMEFPDEVIDAFLRGAVAGFRRLRDDLQA